MPYSGGDLICPVGGDRPLTGGEIALARSVYGDAIDYSGVLIKRRKFFPLHPRGVTMAPMGHLHFHPGATHYCDDFSIAPLHLQAHFIHEMTHVWQSQVRGRWYLVLHRHPWCRYDYALKPGWKLSQYGIEQQAEIVRHTFLIRNGARLAGAPSLSAYEAILPFHTKRKSP
ncbi:vgr related protein [Erythrobacter sp. R86502]|uniref:vgr related protein n=1 Tax=Erythrobacter sp. R86502 TaxID=3093846 RepID=UPI0036D29DE5